MKYEDFNLTNDSVDCRFDKLVEIGKLLGFELDVHEVRDEEDGFDSIIAETYITDIGV